jgi:hypothetical protein
MFNSLPIRSPTRLASATQSSIVTPRIGTNGTTSVAPEIDQAGRGVRALECRFPHRLRRPHKREHRSVVILIHLLIQQKDALDGPDCRHERANRVRVPSLAKIRHAFDQAFNHKVLG